MTAPFILSALSLNPGLVVYFTSEPQSRTAGNLRSRALRHGLGFETRTPPVAAADGLVASRLYNVGNISSNSYAYISPGQPDEVVCASFESLFDRLIDVTSWDNGSIDVTDYDAMELGFPTSLRRARRMPPAHGALMEMAEMSPVAEPDEDDVLECELYEVNAAQRELLRKIGMLITDYVRTYHKMPHLDSLLESVQGRFIVDDDISPVVINADMEIVLPGYDEMHLRLTPLCRAIYILFLLHPEGIVLKNIDSYSRQLRDIYLLVKPGADDALAAASLADICSPGSESLLQKISLIKRAVSRQLINPATARHFIISGKRGEAYRLEAAVALAHAPACLRSKK